MIALHATLSYPTKPGVIPDPLSRIYYEKQENHDKREKSAPLPACESVIAEYDTSGKGGLTLRDVLRFSNKQKSQHGISGWCIAIMECELTTRILPLIDIAKLITVSSY